MILNWLDKNKLEKYCIKDGTVHCNVYSKKTKITNADYIELKMYDDNYKRINVTATITHLPEMQFQYDNYFGKSETCYIKCSLGIDENGNYFVYRVFDYHGLTEYQCDYRTEVVKDAIALVIEREQLEKELAKEDPVPRNTDRLRYHRMHMTSEELVHKLITSYQ